MLKAIRITEDQWHVRSGSGHLVASYPSQPEAQAFIDGHAYATELARRLVRVASEGLGLGLETAR